MFGKYIYWNENDSLVWVVFVKIQKDFIVQKNWFMDSYNLFWHKSKKEFFLSNLKGTHNVTAW